MFTIIVFCSNHPKTEISPPRPRILSSKAFPPFCIVLFQRTYQLIFGCWCKGMVVQWLCGRLGGWAVVLWQRVGFWAILGVGCSVKVMAFNLDRDRWLVFYRGKSWRNMRKYTKSMKSKGFGGFRSMLGLNFWLNLSVSSKLIQSYKCILFFHQFFFIFINTLWFVIECIFFFPLHAFLERWQPFVKKKSWHTEGSVAN